MNDIPVGIDLGTTYSAVAMVDNLGKPQVIPNCLGEFITPSVISFTDVNPIIGTLAEERERYGEYVARLFKREMGTPHLKFNFNGQDYSPIELSSILLAGLKRDAEAHVGLKLNKAIITVPAYFTNIQREATIEAGKMAGFDVLRTINEPTAAALAYYQAHTMQGEKKLFVYDLGGGTFDITVVRIGQNLIEVIATDGNHRLGGKDWDDAILRDLAIRFQDKFGYDPLEDRNNVPLLRMQCEKAKRRLSQLSEAKINISCSGDALSYTLERTHFENITKGLREATCTLCQKILGENSLTWEQIDGTILVGGSSRMTQAHELILEMTGKHPLRGVNVDEAVALGAALQAFIDIEKSNSRSSFFTNTSQPTSSPKVFIGSIPKVVDVMSHSLGMVAESSDRSAYINSIIIPKNTPIPSIHTRPYIIQTHKTKGSSMEVFMLQGESAHPGETIMLGKYVFNGIEATSSGKAIVDIHYSYDVSGVVKVSATQQDTQKELPPPIIEKVPTDLSWLCLSPKEHAATNDSIAHVTIYLLIDISGSMWGKPIKIAKEAAIELTSKLDFSRFSLGIIEFADDVDEILPPVQDVRKIHKSLDKMKANGGGNSGNPFPLAREYLAGIDTAKYLVVLTDGRWEKTRQAVLTAEKCHREGIEIIALGFGSADEKFLKAIASCDANALFLNLSELVGTFSKIGQELTKNLTAPSLFKDSQV